MRLGLLIIMLCLVSGIASAGPAPVELQLTQSVVYPNDSSYKITILVADPTRNQVRFGNGSYTLSFEGKPLRTFRPCPAQSGEIARVAPCFSVEDAARTKLSFSKLMVKDFAGANTFTVASSDGWVSSPLNVTLSPCPAATPRVVAVGLTLFLLSIIGWLLKRGRPVTLSNGRQVSLLKATLIDTATSTYSLSKMQLYIWLAAGSTTYLYFLLANVMVLGQLQLQDVPTSIPGVALISVATAVMSNGVDSVAGGKGSGAFLPTLSDFVTSGGDVAPERVQQLLWTAIAAPGFVIFAYLADPGTMQIPHLPDSFLSLMGISSAGYIGGKIARGPGPKITGVTYSVVAGPPARLDLAISGSDIQTNGAVFHLTDKSVPSSPDIVIPPLFKPNSKIGANGVATYIEHSVPAVGINLAPKPVLHLSIVTADGERADWDI